MVHQLEQLDNNLASLYKRVPALPSKTKAWLVQWLPWGSLIGGFFTLGSVWAAWNWTHDNAWIDYENKLNALYGGPIISRHSTGPLLWLALLLLLTEAVLYLLAVSRLCRRDRSGWDYLFYAALLNTLYGLAAVFTSYGGIGSFLGAVLSSAVALYLLYQIRDRYTTPPTKTIR